MEEGTTTTRPSWTDYFMGITQITAKRSTCLKEHMGAVLVKDKRILTTGYNGAPKGVKNCLDRGSCLREEMGIPSGQRHEMCRGLHAEQNAIIQAAYHGVNIKDSVIYSTTQPCVQCAKMIINSGIKKIYCFETYPDDLALELLNEAGIDIIKLRT